MVSKYPMGCLGGLSLTASAGHDALFPSRVALTVLYTLQLDRNPVALCSELHDEELRLANFSSPPLPHEVVCFVPVVSKMNIFSSVAMPQNTKALEGLLSDSEALSLLELWEVRYLKASLAFCQFNFVECAKLCCEAVVAEPCDAFSVRLLFISTFNCGLSRLLAEALSSAIPFLPKAPQRTDEVDGFAARPYYHALLGFAMNEVGLGAGTASPLYHSLLAIDQVRAYNSAALYGETWIHPFAVHTVCHLMSSTPEEGLRYVNEVIPRSLWEGSPYFACHLYFHIIAMYMDTEQPAQALDLYDTRLFPLAVADDMYALSDASSVLGRMRMADIISHNDPRTPALCDKWVRAACDHSTDIHRFSFFVMNLTSTAAIFRSDEGVDPHLVEYSVTAASRCEEPYRSIFMAVLSESDASLGGTRKDWKIVGGSKGQIDILERLRVWLLGKENVKAAIVELRKAFVLYPHVPYYNAQVQRLELLANKQ